MIKFVNVLSFLKALTVEMFECGQTIAIGYILTYRWMISKEVHVQANVSILK